MKDSPRQKLLEFVETGQLRDAATGANLDDDAVDLLVKVVLRYCEPRFPRRRRSSPQPSEGPK